MNQPNFPTPPIDEDELSLTDIVNFILEDWRIIVGFTLLGLGAAVAFINLAPKQYEAIAQIKMAQIASPNNNNNNINPLGVNIEEPAALIARMALPTTYSSEITEACGLSGKEDSSQLLTKKIKLSIPRQISNTIDLKLRDASPELAKNCSTSVFNLIKSSQEKLIAPYIEDAKSKLAIEQERLARATQLITRADKSGAAFSAAYLATRDEIRYLLDQITGLQNIITQNESRATRLTAPIYIKDQPVFPPQRNSLLIGILGGGFLGLLFALIRKWYRSHRKLLLDAQ
jgi:LPS O-antigen subunit length determinant protein (WzzB/FepE family)